MDKTDFTLDEFIKACKGRPFGSLVLHHINKNKKSIFTSKSKLIRIFSESLNQSIQSLPEEARPLIEGFIDKWNSSIKQRSYWSNDCAESFSKIINDAKNIFSDRNIPFNDDILFEMFNIVIMNYAYNAVCEKNMEGIRDGL